MVLLPSWTMCGRIPAIPKKRQVHVAAQDAPKEEMHV